VSYLAFMDENEAVRIAHRVAVTLDHRQPIVTVANVLTQQPWNLDYRDACLFVGAALRDQPIRERTPDA
jgi:hypothetical protein